MTLVNYFIMLLAGLVFLGVGSAWCAPPPSGGYTSTCTQARMEGDTLSATCKNSAGKYVPASLMVKWCVSGSIKNENGKLVCTDDTAARARAEAAAASVSAASGLTPEQQKIVMEQLAAEQLSPALLAQATPVIKQQMATHVSSLPPAQLKFLTPDMLKLLVHDRVTTFLKSNK